MSNAKKSSAEVQPCPNCATELPVPKSTRSFICRSCDAIIKVIGTDDGIALKVVGKSVEDDPTYQAYEAQAAELVAELDELHKRYLVEMAKKPGAGNFRRGIFGVVILFGGLIVMIWSLAVGATLAGFGLLVAVASFSAHSRRKAAFEAHTGEISRTMEKIGQRRDLIQRKAARMKVEI
ncbi:MAG: hypothetical protein IPF53_07395 [Blastocatellia bacterium]|nr:hypothetical protein [Blastocatellia bacterium]MBK6427934.1 hypothetical protein [Blastocatellia bacterium]